MKILLYSKDIDCGGNISNLWYGINKYSDDECRMFVGRESRWKYKTDVVGSEDKKMLPYLIDWADLIVVHGFPYDLPDFKRKPLYFWDMTNWESDKCMSEDYKKGNLMKVIEPFKKVITFAPHHTKLFGDKGVWLPPIVRTDDPLLQPEESRRYDEKIIVCQSPSGDDKNTEELKKVIKELQDEGLPVELKIIHGIEHDDCLREKRKCHILFDNIRQAWWGQSGYEGLSQGLMVFARLDPDLFFSFDECPVHHVKNMEDFKIKIKNLFANQELLIKNFCEDSSEWIKNNYSIENNIQKWIKFFEEELK